MPNKKNRLVADRSALLDPLNCGSAISYSIINGSRRVYGDVRLHDCDRSIKWYFGYDGATEKIDAAIEILEEFRDKFKAAKAVRVKRTRKKPVKRATA